MAYSVDMTFDCGFILSGDPVRAVGWISEGRSFRTGIVDGRSIGLERRFFHERIELCAVFYQPNPYFIHTKLYDWCSLCKHKVLSCFLLLPGKRFLFVSPALLLHYIDAHSYHPPEEFLQELAAFPIQDTILILDEGILSKKYISMMANLVSAREDSKNFVRSFADGTALVLRLADAHSYAQRLEEVRAKAFEERDGSTFCNACGGVRKPVPSRAK